MRLADTCSKGCCAVCFAAMFLMAQEAPVTVFRSESRLVDVYASVFDRKGNPVDGILKERFAILDAGSVQPIVSFETESKSISCAILLDTTGSMKDALASVKNAVSMFVDELREDDSAAIFGFSTSLRTLQDFTTDRGAAKRAALRTKAGGATALFDAVVEVAKLTSARSGKKAIVLFTDGSDNASSLRTEAAISRVAKIGIPIYAIAEGEAAQSHELKKQLRRITEATGGQLYEIRNTKNVSGIFEDILSELKHVYLLSYKPPQDAGGKWHDIQIRITGLEAYRVRGRTGYFPN